jgi:putative two-component system response regulator
MAPDALRDRPPPDPDPRDREIQGSTILVADDDPSVRLLLATMLEVEGYSVVQVGDGLSALEKLKTESVDAVLLDVLMPSMDGIETCRRIRNDRHTGHIPVVMVTASQDREIRLAGKEAGCDEFVTKPVDSTELLIRMRNLVRIKLYQEHLVRSNEELSRRVQEGTQELRTVLQLLEDANEEIRLSREETIRRLARAAEFRDDETARHDQRMSQYAALVARKLGLDDRRCEHIRIGSLLHDIGKIGISDTILLKPGKLTVDEFEKMKEHSEIGYRILTGSRYEMLDVAATVAWTHHERFDGTGYPRGIAGDDIPIEGQVAAVADVFDALTSHRVYREAFPVDEALSMVEGSREKHFAPDVFDAFSDSIDEVLAIRDEYADLGIPA